MGLLNEINNVNRTLKDTQQKESTKAEQNEIQKIRKQKLEILLKQNMNKLFENVKNQKGIDKLTIELLKHKQDNIKILMDIYFEKYNVKLNCYELNYIDEIYNKTIYKIKKEYTEIFKQDTIKEKEEEKEKKEIEKLRQIQLKEAQKQQTFNNILKAIKTIIFILSAPFILLIYFVIGICKNVK